MPQYVALLRGINVGGSNLIKMTDLAACCSSAGLSEVRTYIASGNVLFSSSEPADALEDTLEAAFSDRFDYSARVVVVREDALRRVVERAPRGFGSRPKEYRYDVIFFRRPATARQALKEVPTKEGVDRVWAANDVLYFSRLDRKASQSKLPRLVQLPVYKSMTIRNWNTTTKLLELLRRPSGG